MSLANMHGVQVQHRSHMFYSMLLEHLGTFGKHWMPLGIAVYAEATYTAYKMHKIIFLEVYHLNINWSIVYRGHVF